MDASFIQTINHLDYMQMSESHKHTHITRRSLPYACSKWAYHYISKLVDMCFHLAHFSVKQIRLSIPFNSLFKWGKFILSKYFPHAFVLDAHSDGINAIQLAKFWKCIDQLDFVEAHNKIYPHTFWYWIVIAALEWL